VRVVLDSNIAIAAMNQVSAELAYGARRSRRVDQNLGRLAALREEFAAMPVSDAVADRYARFERIFRPAA